MHQLDGAYERVNGAHENLDALKPLIASFAQVVANGVSLDYHMGDTIVQGRQRRVPIGRASGIINQPAPLRISRLIGYVVHDLRAALDYLVYELACFDTKSVVDNTQFVIVDSEEDFRGQKRHFRGLKGEHIAAFERLQPYNGHQLLGTLRDLSNPEKHEHLTVVKSPVVVRIDDHVTKAKLAGEQVDVNSYALVTITFSDGTPVIERLEKLIDMTVQILERFKPEFQGG